MPIPAFSTGNWMQRKDYKMSLFEEQKAQLLTEMTKLHTRHELSGKMGPDFFEPGMMEYQAQANFEYTCKSLGATRFAFSTISAMFSQ